MYSATCIGVFVTFEGVILILKRSFLQPARLMRSVRLDTKVIQEY